MTATSPAISGYTSYDYLSKPFKGWGAVQLMDAREGADFLTWQE